MSPDPPRDSDSDHNGLSNGIPHNLLVLNEEDMGEGDHELDFSSHESEMTSDEDDDQDVHGNENEAEASNGNSRIRAHYQMLIPFANASDNGIQEFHHADCPVDDDDDNDNGTSTEQSSSQLATSVDVVEQNTEVSFQEDVKREITLTSDKVDTIKDAMKNFTLPSAAIPPWAKDISEDDWKSKLISKITK